MVVDDPDRYSLLGRDADVCLVVVLLIQRHIDKAVSLDTRIVEVFKSPNGSFLRQVPYRQKSL